MYDRLGWSTCSRGIKSCYTKEISRSESTKIAINLNRDIKILHGVIVTPVRLRWSERVNFLGSEDAKNRVFPEAPGRNTNFIASWKLETPRERHTHTRCIRCQVCFHTCTRD